MKYNGFCAASYTVQSILTDYEQCMNWYVETSESPFAKSQSSLYPTPGFRFWSTASPGAIGTTATPGRAIEQMNNRLFAVMGDTYGEILPDGSFVPYGVVAVDHNPAHIAFNQPLPLPAKQQALIASGGNVYVHDLRSPATAPDFQQTLTTVGAGYVSTVGMLDGYFLAFEQGNGRMWVSTINDGSSWDATQFIQRFDAPDTWNSLIVVPPDIWLVGPMSGTVLYDSGAFPFPFAPRPGLNFKYGNAAPYSIAASRYQVFWLSENKEGGLVVVGTRGYAPVRISTFAVEHAIQNYVDRGLLISDAEGWIYQSRGHTFYVLQFPSADATWVYDIDLGYWHERGYWDVHGRKFTHWKPRFMARSFGVEITVDRETNQLALMNQLFPTELDGSAIRRVRRAPGIFQERRQIPIQSIDLYLEAGTSNAQPPGDNATIIWRTSDDGGRTWGTERQEPIGRLGDYSAMVRMWGFGVPRDRVNELVVSDPITSWRVTDCYVNSHGPGGGSR